ncbi:MICAL-like protein 2 [Elgaria multicarinata webbii]|uniref:MICAL-like protein 2 n=1 Tax=Elgaria multicarinata webbii TaxID=159646 RepID=UPI002FCD1B56
MAAIQNLQKWCKQQCDGYNGVSITNMTTSFRDGLAFCAILHRHRPDLINFSSLSKENVFENNQLAFRVAESELGIPALLDAEDMVALRVPDRLSILTYVSQYYNYFHGKSPIGGMAGIKRPPSEPREEPIGKKFVSEPVTPGPPKPSRHLPPEPKANPALQGRGLVKENSPVTARRVLAENNNMRSSNCAVCGNHVHLVQRLLMDGKLYHRNCFRCKQCSNTLRSGNYKAGKDPGTLVCNQHGHPTQLPNSLTAHPKDVTGENKPTDSASVSGRYSKGLETKKPAPESAKTSQAFRSGDAVKAMAWEPSKPGNDRPSSVAASPSSRRWDPAGNKPVLRETPAASPLPWTASAAKTQQARAKFFQSVPADETEPVKSQSPPFKPPQGAGKASSPGTHARGTDAGGSEKDQARSFLMQALPGSQPAPNRSGGSDSTSASTSPRSLASKTSKPSLAPSSLQRFEPEKVSGSKILRPVIVSTSVEKPARGSPGTPPTVERLPKDPAQKVGIGTAAPNKVKDQPSVRPADSGRKLDVKVTKGVGAGANPAEEKSEAPADWRSRLKPVANKASDPGDDRSSRKPVGVHNVVLNVTVSPAKDEKKPALLVTIPVIRDAAPSSDQPKKKKLLVPSLDILGGWQKPQQEWEDDPAAQKAEVPGPPKRAVAPFRPSSPRTFQKHPSGQVVSPSKLRPDYIPEEKIQKEVRQIERDLDKLELQGVDMEKELRKCEGDDTEDALMVEWFKLIHEKQLLLRRESELMHKMNQQKLEEKQWDIESELRGLMSKSDVLKSPKEKAREEELLNSYVATVNDRNRIIEDLDEDRIREREEDEMIAAMIQSLDVSRNTPESDKKKTKFSFLRILKTKS